MSGTEGRERERRYWLVKSEPDEFSFVDLCARERFGSAVPLGLLRETAGLDQMVLLQKGSRLSVQPVRPDEWQIVCRLGMGGEGGHIPRGRAPDAGAAPRLRRS